MHYVTGGTGAPLVLLHWPQSWYQWRRIMPSLAQRYTVYAVDLPGLGDSRGAPPSYDKATLARFVHALLADRLGLRAINLVGHDLGAGVGFQYAVQFPDEVVRYAHLDYPLPGPALTADKYRSLSWHEFARTNRRPQVLTGGFELYRTLEQDERDNLAAAPITMPVMLMTAEGLLDFTRSTVDPRMTRITRAVEVPGSGHWLPQENPAFATARLLDFLAAGGTR
ncbi:alpha/beta fold hydrolase [Plantactinospora sp. CA-294935]|uniref:alpha/beta fold hydrolase n=1 Tax=Plantactinospora sp. CA-294935 TaxID=3240012 RepID=UPI003D933A98